MESIAAPKTIEVFVLVKQTGLAFCTIGTNSAALGSGFFYTLKEAEHQRTMEVLREESTPSSSKSLYHIFELTVPNPGYKEV